MRPTNAIYKLIIFSLVFLMCHTANAQNSSGLFQKNRNIQPYISFLAKNDDRLDIFASDSCSKKITDVFLTRPYELSNNLSYSNQPTIINGAGTPKGAVFCQFENKLWKSFDIGIRLRVETPTPIH